MNSKRARKFCPHFVNESYNAFWKDMKVRSKVYRALWNLERVSKVDYRLALPNELSITYGLFHKFQLKKYIVDKSHALVLEPLELDETLNYKERFVRILDTQVNNIRCKDIPMVIVLWANQNTREATLEIKESMRQKYLRLFL